MFSGLQQRQFDMLDTKRDGFLSRGELEAQLNSDAGGGCVSTKRRNLRFGGDGLADIFLLGLSAITLLVVGRSRR